MARDVSPTAAEYIWETAQFYLAPRLTPHPNDDLVDDLPIDDGDWSVDWPVDFAKRHGFSDKLYPDWPDGWPATLRNYGKWLDMGLRAAGKDSRWRCAPSASPTSSGRAE